MNWRASSGEQSISILTFIARCPFSRPQREGKARRAYMSETVRISTLEGDASFSAYCARPDGDPRAAIVVIQEIFGVNAGIRRKCDRLAEDGYLALAPDLFWRLEPGVELDPDVEAEFKQALELMGRFDQDQGIADIEAAI